MNEIVNRKMRKSVQKERVLPAVTLPVERAGVLKDRF